jgi:hypothetical protein
VELTTEFARLGEQIEAVVYIHQAVSAIKVEAMVKSAYFSLTEAMPLSPEAKALGELVTTDADRWQVTAAEDGQISVWYSGKAGWDGGNTYPALRLRWQLTAPLPSDKLAISFKLTTIDRNGEATTEVIKLPILMEGSDPKIDQVDPTSVVDGTDTVIYVQGTNFDDTAKLYLVDSTQEIQLVDVSANPDGGGVLATVPAGTKPGVYKLRLVNPDGGSTEYDGYIVVRSAQSSNLFLPIIIKD